MRRQRCLILSTNILNFSITFPTPVTYENYSLEVLLQTLPCLQKKIICRLVTISYCSHEMLYIIHMAHSKRESFFGLRPDLVLRQPRDDKLGKSLGTNQKFLVIDQVGARDACLKNILHFPKEILLLACNHIWSHENHEMTNWSFGCSLLGRRPVLAAH